MEYVIIGACIVVAIAGGIVLYVKNKRTKNELGNTAVVVSKTSSSKLQASEVANDPVIQIGILPADAISDETKLVEITDSKVLAHINNLVPGLAQAGNAANNATQAVKANGEVLYRAIIPAGAKLTDSKAMEGAVRGFYHGADGIRGHANLVAVEAQKGTAVAAMGVASMIVGQYYMTQINAELGVISDGISQIQNFQDNEYRSRVFSLVAHVKKIADFQTEILENDELRLSKIAQLDSLEEECTKLLGQANLTLAGFAKKSGLNYDGYEKALGHKKPFDSIGKDEQIDILIVVNQMLTGFDSKFVNTLYLDKMMEYENLIQAFSRTNRLYNMAEKPFGIIKYYRRPNTMEKNIEAAVKAYSGDVPTGLFVDKLPNNLRNMNVLFQSIEQIFKNAGIVNFEKLPADNAAIGKFAKEFNKFVNHLEAAIIQGFTSRQEVHHHESSEGC